MSMYGSGILVLTYRPQRQFLYKLLTEAARCVNQVLYVDLWSETLKPPSIQSGNSLDRGKPLQFPSTTDSVVSIYSYYDLMRDVYQKASSLVSNVDVRVLLPPAVQLSSPRKFSSPVEVCIGNVSSISNLMEFEHLVSRKYEFRNERFAVQYVSAVDDFKAVNLGDCSEGQKECTEFAQYPGVVIGGTFDKVHDGHKLLMGVAALLGTQKFTAGVSDGPLLERKVLKELISPLEERIEYVDNFVKDVRPGLLHKIVGLEDPAGPSGTDNDLDLLVVSEETASGIDVVNEVRKDNGLDPLELHVVNMVLGDEDSSSSPVDCAEVKASSTQKRISLLGTLRKCPNQRRKDNFPYVIGITGGIASGKSSISKRLQKLGAGIINCDKLGHQAYSPGRPAYEKLLEEFGTSILNEDDTINRRKLGSIVFADRNQLTKLNSIVWPEIARMVDEKLVVMWHDGVDVCIVEAAVLLEAGWDSLVNEIWVSVVPREEAMKRIVSRDSLTSEQAEIRIDAQMSNKERVDKAHVVLSTLWEPEFTQRQVEKAWHALVDRAHISIRGQTASL